MKYMNNVYAFALVLLFSNATINSMDTFFKVVLHHEDSPHYGVPCEIKIDMSLLADKESKEVLAQATVFVFKDVPLCKAPWVLDSHFFGSHYFKNLFSEEKNTMIFLKNLKVNKKQRSKGLGTRLFTQALGYLSEHHNSNSIMIWHVVPFGKNPVPLEKLCVFFKKNGGTMIGSDERCAYFCKVIKKKAPVITV